MQRNANPLRRSAIFVAQGFNPGLADRHAGKSSVGAAYPPLGFHERELICRSYGAMNLFANTNPRLKPGATNITLLRSLEFICEYQPPVETGGYKYYAPTERGCYAA
jgi:hypothetical protein